MLVSPANTGLGGYYGALARLPDVAALAPMVGLNAGGPGASGPVTAPLDGRFGHLLEIPKVLSGRLPRPNRPDEVAVDQIGANILHLQLGSKLVLGACYTQVCSGTHVRHLSERVVGIVVTRGSVVAVTDLDKVPAVFASPALFHQLGTRYRGEDWVYVKLRPGTAPGRFGLQAQALARHFPDTGGQVFIGDESTQAAAVERSIRPEAVALALFALVLAITALLIVGQAAVRLMVVGSADNPTLAALGMTRGQLAAAGLIEVGLAAAAGVLVAAGRGHRRIAVDADRRGTAGRAGPRGQRRRSGARHRRGGDRGAAARADRVAGLAHSPRPAARTPGDAGGARTRRSLLARGSLAPGAPVTATAGVRLALEPGRGGTPSRCAARWPARPCRCWPWRPHSPSALTCCISCTAPVSTARAGTPRSTFSSRPSRRGRHEHLLGTVRGVSGWSFGDHGIIGVNGLVIPAIGVTSGKGPLHVTDPAGGPRAAHGSRDRARHLGPAPDRAASRAIGQRDGQRPAAGRPHRRPGRLPELRPGQLHAHGPRPGRGDHRGRLRAAATASGNGPGGYEFVLLRFVPGPPRRRTSPASPGLWPATAQPSSSRPAW